MRVIAPFLLSLILLGNSGCASAPRNAADGAEPERVASSAVVTNKPTIRPADGLTGRIIAVREPLRFVIVDFAASRLPMLDQQLSVYRLDQKVAELKVSGPYLGTTVAADVTAGQALEGDLVRDR